MPVTELTARQRVFLEKLLDLYQEHQGPVHYSVVAEHVGVGSFAAYDMLKILEKKGFASSSYALATEHSGPGRSMVVFAPTPRAAAIVAISLDDIHLRQEWKTAREQVLEMLRSTRNTNPTEVLADLMARLPEAKAPITYCTEMIGALLLNMKRATERAGGLTPFRALSALRTGASAQLETLAGLSVGATLSADSERAHTFTQRLLDYARRYQSYLSRLSEETRSMLVQFLEEALEALD